MIKFLRKGNPFSYISFMTILASVYFENKPTIFLLNSGKTLPYPSYKDKVLAHF